MTAAAVSVTGIIGFVGLMVPHLARGIVGSDHRWLLPGAAVIGAAFLVTCDAVGRSALAPLEVRVSIITGLLGGPFFLYLLRQRLARR
jgi:iron complex transport system permease protein